MKKILIISKEQFGYHTDIFKWCEHLRDEYRVEAVTFEGKPKVAVDGVKVHYVSNSGNRTIRGIRYVLTCLWLLLFFKGIVMVCYFRECRILKWCLPWKKMILDIRTLDVNSDKDVRAMEDALIVKATELYDYVTIISEGLRDKIALPKEKSAILPLGADVVSTTEKSFDTIRMMYVGTLFNRDVHKTVEGLALALERNKSLDIHYDINYSDPRYARLSLPRSRRVKTLGHRARYAHLRRYRQYDRQNRSWRGNRLHLLQDNQICDIQRRGLLRMHRSRPARARASLGNEGGDQKGKA